MNFTEQDLQIIIAGLLELPAKVSFDLLNRIREELSAIKQEGQE